MVMVRALTTGGWQYVAGAEVKKAVGIRIEISVINAVNWFISVHVHEYVFIRSNYWIHNLGITDAGGPVILFRI